MLFRKTRVHFSLRGALGVVAILAVVLGIEVNGARRQKAAIAAITEVDGDFYYRFQYDGATYSTRDYPIGPEWLWSRMDLSYISNVVAVGLNSKMATDDTLERIGYLRELEVLDLTYSRITDRGLRHLRGLRKLKYLRLDGTNTTDVGLEDLKKLQNIETLYLCNTAVTERSMATMCKMKRLKEHYLTEGQFSPEYMKDLTTSLPHCKIYTVKSETVIETEGN